MMNKKQAAGQRRKKLKRTGVIVLTAIVLAIPAVIFIKRESSVAAVIDGAPLYIEEYRLTEEEQRAEVIAYFQRNYDVEYTEEFWESEYGEELPSEMLKKETREECVRIKVMQRLAEEKGLAEDTSYENINREMEEENRRRRKNIEEGRPVYGASQYTSATYYEYYNSNLSAELKKELEKDELKYTEEDVYEYYIEHPDYFYRINRVEYQYVFSERKEQTGKMKEQIQAGESADRITEKGTKIYEGVLDESTERTLFLQNEPLYNCLQTIQPGECSDIFETDNGFAFVYCTDRSGGTAAFEQIRADAEARFTQEQYDNYINQKSKEADAEWRR